MSPALVERGRACCTPIMAPMTPLRIVAAVVLVAALATWFFSRSAALFAIPLAVAMILIIVDNWRERTRR